MSRSMSDLDRSRCMRIAMERFRMPCRSMPSSAAATTGHSQLCRCPAVRSCWRMALLCSASGGLARQCPALQRGQVLSKVRNTIMHSSRRWRARELPWCSSRRHAKKSPILM